PVGKGEADRGPGAGGQDAVVHGARRGRHRSTRVIVDAHSDLLAELVHRRGEDGPFARWWRPELDAGGVGLQVCAIFTAGKSTPDAALRSALAQAGAYHRLLAENADVVPVTSASDLDRLEGRLGVLLSIEGVEALAGNPQLAHAYWGLGV